MSKPPPIPASERDAYTKARRINEGCQHQLGCKCAPPYWLREPTEKELARWTTPATGGDSK